jgi:hypothetical protein
MAAVDSAGPDGRGEGPGAPAREAEGDEEVTPPAFPLAEASRRQRRPPGRPRRLGMGESAGPAVQGAATGPAPDAAIGTVFAASVPLPRAFPLRVTRGRGAAPEYPASAYSGIPLRTLMRLIAAGTLRPIKVPGMGRCLLDRLDLDRLLESSKVAAP